MNLNSLFRTLAVTIGLTFLSLTTYGQTAWTGGTSEQWSGEGTESSPYLITTADDLAGLAKRTNAGETFEGMYFRLTSDISLSDPAKPDEEKTMWTPIGSRVFEMIPDSPDYTLQSHWFKGNFDGDGHTISNLFYSGSNSIENWDDLFDDGGIDFSHWHIALFGLLDGATIKNLTLTNAKVIGAANIAGIACESVGNTTFSDISVQGTFISGNAAVGGSAAAIVARGEDSHLIRCSAQADVRGIRGQGLIAGSLTKASTAQNCSASGKVWGIQYDTGGFIGNTDSMTVVSDCSVKATVGREIYHVYTTQDCGGFVGQNWGKIVRCSASGTVKGKFGGAGFCGTNVGVIESCYTTANVALDDYGCWAASFVVLNGTRFTNAFDDTPGIIRNCYATGSVKMQPALEGGLSNHIGGFTAGIVAASETVNCAYNTDSIPEINAFLLDETSYEIVGESGFTTTEMKSADFADRLNMLAAVMGTDQWQYNAGAYPTPTATVATSTSPWFAGGIGTESSPIQIANKTQLENLAKCTNSGYDFHGKYIIQTADIALNAPFESWGEQMPTPWTPIGRYLSSTSQANYFRGVYDGGMHTISNLYIDDLDNDYLGLFGVLGNDVHIKNLGVTDAWINGTKKAGILAGASKIHNDLNTGTRRITRVWTSGEINSGQCASILGESPAVGSMILTACSSTATIKQKGNYGGVNGYSYPFIDNGYTIDTETRYYGCWFGGKLPTKNDGTHYPIFKNGFIHSYVDGDKNPMPADARHNVMLTTEYMQSKDFVNDMNYAAALNGCNAGWGYSAGSYPTFGGEQPTLTVTISDEISDNVSFKVFSGSSMMAPVAPERDGYTISGWYTDSQFSQLFRFLSDKFNSNTTLYAKWIQNIVADYEIFKNKFATTFNITTAAQLYGLSDIVNGIAPGIERNDFAGKTIKLANDIVLNDPANFDLWGKSVTPVRFNSIGDANVQGKHPFNGKFDGNGHAIIGLYTTDESILAETGYISPGPGLFDELGASSEVTNLILRNAMAAVSDGNAALLAQSTAGKIVNCGVEGKISVGNVGRNAVVAGLVTNTQSTSSVSGCYAKVDIEIAYTASVGGLIAYAYGDVSNSFVTGSVNFTSDYGSYGGVVLSSSKPMTNCYAALKLDWHMISDRFVNYGGAYSTGSGIHPSTYYDRTLLGNSFEQRYESQIAAAYARGNGLTTEQMHTMATFPDWNFDTVWGRRADQNDGYPYLRWTAPGLENDAERTPVPASSITLNETSFEGENGATLQLTATVAPEDADNKDVTWSSSDTNVATVSETGLVTITGEGTATITATAADGSGVTATCTVTGLKPAVLITRIRLSESYFEAEKIGATLQLTARISPYNATNQKLDWSSSNETVATVDQTGLITVTGYGEAVITAAATDGSETTATCEVRCVKPHIFVESITLDKTSVQANIGETVQLTATVMPDDADDKNVYWRSHDESIATVDQTGLVRIVGAGTTTITATATGDGSSTGLSAECTVTGIRPFVPVSSITLNETSFSGEAGATLQLTATVAPDDATDKAIIWSSSDETVATVDASGLVTIVSVGKAIITATAADGSGAFATCEVNCTSGINSISMDSDEHVEIYSSHGYLVYSGRMADAHLGAGLYMIRRDNGTVAKVIIH